MKNIVIFASGEGTNAQKLIDYFRDSTEVKIALVISGNPDAYVLQRAQKAAIPSLVVTRESFKSSYLVKILKDQKIELIVLAGFLWLLPESLIQAFPKRIINIHPALLPKYGGKGMYGMNVHAAVYYGKEKETGITVHYVDEIFDNGEILLQEKCAIDENDDVNTISKKVQELEHKFFPIAVEKALAAIE